MMTHLKGKKTLGWRAHQSSLRVVPMQDDPEAYRRSLDYYRLGFARGFLAAQRVAKTQSK